MHERMRRFTQDRAVQDLDDAAVDAFVLLGVLKSDDAARRKVDRARRLALVEAPADPSAAAVEAGRALTAELFPAAADAGERERDLMRFLRVAATLEHVGAALPPGDYSTHIERLLPPPEQTAPIVRPPEGEPTGFAAAELQSVVIGPPERLDGIRVTALELYADCVIVRLHFLVDEKDDGRRPLYAGQLGDDLGTDYRLVELPGPKRECPPGDDVPRTNGWQVFEPGVPAGAAQLVYAKAGIEIVVADRDHEDAG